MSFCVLDLLLIYQKLVYGNHGRNLKYLEDEEMELTCCIVCLFLFSLNIICWTQFILCSYKIAYDSRVGYFNCLFFLF